MSKSLSKDIIQKIREEVLNGKTKYSVARDMNLSNRVVYYYTRDIPSRGEPGRPGIRGKTLYLLKQLLEDGYVISGRNLSPKLHTLRKHFPVIKSARVDNKTIYFLDDKNKVALKALLEAKKSRVINYQDLASMTQVFNLNLSGLEKKELLGKNECRKFPIIRKKEGGYMSSFKKAHFGLQI